MPMECVGGGGGGVCWCFLWLRYCGDGVFCGGGVVVVLLWWWCCGCGIVVMVCCGSVLFSYFLPW